MSERPTHLGEALRLMRVFHDMTLTEVALLVGRGNSHLSEVENGKKPPSLDLLQRYADAFKIPLSSLVLFSEHVSSPSDKAARAVAKKVIRMLQWIEERSHEH